MFKILKKTIRTKANFFRNVENNFTEAKHLTDFYLSTQVAAPLAAEAADLLISVTHARLCGAELPKVLTFKDLQTSLLAAWNSEKPFVVILSPGQFFLDGFFKELSSCLLSWPRGTVLMGHILDYRDKGKYFELHPMFNIVNTQELRKIFKTQKELQELFLLAQTGQAYLFNDYWRAEENIHDHYTPIYLLPKPKGKVRLEQGNLSLLIEAILNRGGRIDNVSPSFREQKAYCYPDKSEYGLLHLLKTGKVLDESYFNYKKNVVKILEQFISQ
jgi:hypothetical protein